MSSQARPESILWQQLKDLPYFRAMVRAVEDSFYQGIELPGPVLDLGSGDGHFASVTFDHPLDVGLDPWWAPLYESRGRKAYSLLTQSEGAKMPFPNAYFATAVSNSVLEHIPQLDEVLVETARVLRPGGHFIFCVPNHRFPQLLLGVAVFKALRWQAAAEWYERFFQRISRHKHCDSYEVWQERLTRSGFKILEHWDYFDGPALHRMEVGHALGLPALVSKKLFGKWVLARNRMNLWLAYLIARKVYHNPYSDQGVYSFYITERLGS